MHIRLQPVVGALPWVANSSPQAATDWSFTALDQTVQPVLTAGDKSPVFQIAKAPGFLTNSSGNFVYNSTNLNLLTTYAQNLVRYYNTGGFTWGGQHFQSASSQHITWWAIFNEPNLNGITAAQYVSIYNTLVPAMLVVDPTLKFVALELSDYTGFSQRTVCLHAGRTPAASGGLERTDQRHRDPLLRHMHADSQSRTLQHFFNAGVTQFATDISLFPNRAGHTQRSSPLSPCG